VTEETVIKEAINARLI